MLFWLDTLLILIVFFVAVCGAINLNAKFDDETHLPLVSHLCDDDDDEADDDEKRVSVSSGIQLKRSIKHCIQIIRLKFKHFFYLSSSLTFFLVVVCLLIACPLRSH